MTASDSHLIETIDDVEAFLRRPGRYHTTTAHQAYGVLIALGWHPWVKLGEELFFVEGTVLFAEVMPPPPSLTPNVVEKIAWGTEPDFYERRLRDYDNWEVAFWRELVQNARDAGATRLDMVCVDDEYEDPETHERVACKRVSARDNGRGMDEATLMRAFFRRGGSVKEVGSVGGFGDAKNLILTPWLGYQVRTQDVVARGRHEEIFAPILTGQPYLEGTEITVWMPLAKTTSPEHAQFLVEQSSLSMHFTINGQRVEQRLPMTSLVLQQPIIIRKGYSDEKTVGELLIYHSPRAKRHGIYVRSHGIYMYEMHGHSGEFKGVVTIEVNAPPVQIFTTKRDALSYESTARADVNAFVNKLGADPKQMLKKVRDKKEVIFRGTGAIEVRQGKVSELAAKIVEDVNLAAMRKRVAGGGSVLTISLGDAKGLIERMEGFVVELQGSDDEGPGIEALPSTFGTMVSQGQFVDVEQVVGAMRLAMWKPDFFLYQNISPWKLPKALHPETLSLKYHQLLQVWTEVCKFVLVQLGMFKPFGVGWVFDTDYDPNKGEAVIAALYKQHEGHDWLLLNPIEIERIGYGDHATFETRGDRFKLGDSRSMEELVSYAVHEITHMQGYMSHTDSYASALTQNIRAVFRLAPVLKKVVKEARAAVREERPAKPRSAPRAEAPKIKIEFSKWSLYPPLDTQEPWFRALWGLFAVANEELARTVFVDEIEYYAQHQSEFDAMMRYRGLNMNFTKQGLPGFERLVVQALNRILRDPYKYRQGRDLIPLQNAKLPTYLRLGGNEAWYASTSGLLDVPQLSPEALTRLVDAMSAVYDLDPIGEFAQREWM